MENILQFPNLISNLQRCNRFFVSSYGKFLLMHSKRQIYDEGTSFPAQSGQITALYRDPGYLTTSMPVYTTYDIVGNAKYLPTISVPPAASYSRVSRNDYSGWQHVYSGTNEYDLQSEVPVDNWIQLILNSSSGTVAGNIRVRYKDGALLSLVDSVNQGYLSPLVMINGFKSSHPSDIANLLYNYSTITIISSTNSHFYVRFKPNKVSVTGVEFYISISGYGLEVVKSSCRFSLSPIIK